MFFVVGETGLTLIGKGGKMRDAKNKKLWETKRPFVAVNMTYNETKNELQILITTIKKGNRIISQFETADYNSTLNFKEFDLVAVSDVVNNKIAPRENYISGERVDNEEVSCFVKYLMNLEDQIDSGMENKMQKVESFLMGISCSLAAILLAKLTGIIH